MAVNSARRGIDLPADLSIGFCDKNGVAGSISVVGEACPVRRPCRFGALHLEEGCGGEETLTAGQAFEELHGHIHRAKNMTSEQVEVFNTSFAPRRVRRHGYPVFAGPGRRLFCSLSG